MSERSPQRFSCQVTHKPFLERGLRWPCPGRSWGGFAAQRGWSGQMSWHVTGVCAGDVPEDAAGSAAPAPLPTGWRQLPPQETPAQVGVLAGCSFGDSAISDGNLSCSKSAAPMRAWLGGEVKGKREGKAESWSCRVSSTTGDGRDALVMSPAGRQHIPRTGLCLRAGTVAMLRLLYLPTPLVPLGKPLGSADTFPCSAARSPGGDKRRSEPGSAAGGKA